MGVLIGGRILPTKRGLLLEGRKYIGTRTARGSNQMGTKCVLTMTAEVRASASSGLFGWKSSMSMACARCGAPALYRLFPSAGCGPQATGKGNLDAIAFCAASIQRCSHGFPMPKPSLRIHGRALGNGRRSGWPGFAQGIWAGCMMLGYSPDPIYASSITLR